MKQPLTTSTKNLTIEGQIIKQPQTIRANNDKLLTRGAKIKTTLNNRNKKWKLPIESQIIKITPNKKKKIKLPNEGQVIKTTHTTSTKKNKLPARIKLKKN